MNVLFNRRFDERFSSIADHVNEEFGSAAALKFKTSILRSCHLVGLFPNMGRVLFDSERGEYSDFRVMISGFHVIIYFVGDGYVEIMSIMDTRTEELSKLREIVLGSEQDVEM